MSSAGKWVLGLLLLAVGAVAVAQTVSNDDGSQADVKNLPAAQSAASASAAAADSAAAKKAAATPAVDVACKKACVEEPELAEGAVNTRQIAPGSVTLSKLAFEVPNLNELENEINARKAAEAASAASAASLASETAKNDAAITAAAQNGLTAEAAARTAAIDQVEADVAAADAALLGSLNKEIADRIAGDDALQLNLNTEIAARQAAVTSLRGELADGTQVAAPIIQINNNEIVGDAVTGNKILDETITADDLGLGSVTTAEILNDTILHEDIATGAVRSTEILDETIVAGDIATGAVQSSEILDETIVAGDIATGAVESSEILDETIVAGDIATGAVESSEILNGTILNEDIAGTTITASKLVLNTLTADQINTNAITADELADNAVDTAAIAANAVTSAKILNNEIIEEDLNATFFGSLATNSEVTTEVGTAITDLKDELATSDPGSNLVHVDNINGLDSSAKNGTAKNLNCNPVGCVDTADLADDSVTSAKIDDETIATADIALGAVTGDAGGVGTGLIGSRTIAAENLAENAVGAFELADNSVDSAAIIDGAVLGGAASAGSAAGDIAEGTITAANIAGNTITAANLDEDSVGSSEIASGAVGSDEIADGTIATLDLDDGAVTTDKQTANAQSASAVGTSISSPATNTVVVTTPLSLSEGSHKVLVTGQVGVSCTCTAGQSATVTARVMDDDGSGPATLVGGLYTITLTSTNASAVIPLSGLAVIADPDDAAATHDYELQLTVATVGVAGIDYSNAVLTAVDLGR